MTRRDSFVTVWPCTYGSNQSRVLDTFLCWFQLFDFVYYIMDNDTITIPSNMDNNSWTSSSSVLHDEFWSMVLGLWGGIRYGVKIRFPHALIMTLLFPHPQLPTLQDKMRYIVQQTTAHASRLARFAVVYKILLTILKYHALSSLLSSSIQQQEPHHRPCCCRRQWTTMTSSPPRAFAISLSNQLYQMGHALVSLVCTFWKHFDFSILAL